MGGWISAEFGSHRPSKRLEKCGPFQLGGRGWSRAVGDRLDRSKGLEKFFAMLRMVLVVIAVVRGRITCDLRLKFMPKADETMLTRKARLIKRPFLV